MGKPNLLRRRSKSSDGRAVSSLVSPSSTTSPSSSPTSPLQPRQSSQGPPNFFYQDPTNRAYSPQPAPPSSFPLGPNSTSSSPSSTSSPSRNQFLSPTVAHGFPQPPQFPSSLRQQPNQPKYPPPPPPTRPLFSGPPPPLLRTGALPGAPALLPPPSQLLSPKTMTRSGGSSTSLSSDVSGGSGFSSFKDEEVEDLASDQEGEEDFVLPVGGGGGRASSSSSLAPPLLSNLRSSSPGGTTTPATSVHSRDTSPHHHLQHPSGPRLPSSSASTPSSPSKAAIHGRTPSGSLISAAPLARTSSQQDSMRSKLPPLTTEFVPPAPAPPAPPKHDFFADTPEESWEARGRRYEEAAAAALMSPQSTYSQASPAMVSRRVTNGGGAAAASGRSLWGADVDDQQPRSPELDLNLSTSFPSAATNGRPLEPTSPAPLSPLPPPRNPARPVSSLRTSRPLGSPTKLASSPDHDHPLPPPPPRYTSPPPQQPQNDIYSPLTPTPNNNFSPPFGSAGAPISSSSSVQAPFKQDYTSSASFNILPKITASSSTTFGDPPLMSHFGEDAFTSNDIPTISTLLSTPRVLRGILQELPIQSVLSLWEAGSKKERRAMDGGRYVREEFRVWGLGWAGYMRGGLDRAGAREGWANVTTGTILDFLSTLSLPPNAILPPHLVLASSVVTLLLRTSHSLLPPPGPHLIPFEEEDCLPVPLQGLHPSLPPSARTRALPNGRELVFPAPLASAIDLASPNSASRSPSILSREGSTTGPRKLRRRSSISSVMSGVTWGASRAKGGAAASMHGSGPPPSSFNNPRIVSSLASIHSTAESPSSSTRVTPPTPRAPEPRRYEFSQNHPPPRNNHRRPTNDSRLSLDSYAHSQTGGGGSSIYSNSASFVPRQRSATGPAPNGWRGDANGNGNGNGSQTNLSLSGGGPTSPIYYDPDAPPMPNLSNPAFKKHGSRESSMLNLSHRSGSSQSPSGGTLASTHQNGNIVPHNGNGNGGNGAGPSRPGFYPHRSSSPDSSESSNPSFPPRGSQSQSHSHSQLHQRYQYQGNGPVEPLFLSSTSPFRFNRAPVLRIVVPLPANVAWPSGAALKMCHRELDASGLLSKMRFGDLVENLCVSWRRREEGVSGGWTSGAMVFIPPFLHPLSTSYSLSPTSPTSRSPQPFIPSHLPPTMDSFLHSPTYYHAVLPLPYIIFLDLLPFGQQIFQSLRLANQRTELPSSRGEILSVDVWIHEAAFTIGGGAAAEGWGGGGGAGGGEMEKGPWAGTTVILESDGTKEGKDDLLSRISGARGTRRPWEILGSKSTRGSVWLKLVRENTPSHET